MKKISSLVLYAFIVFNAEAQLDKYNQLDLHPVSPTAFQFTKYSEMPVNEYTGLPSIQVPLYEIAVDEVRIPLQLTYHAQGHRLSNEASWVGLGWDLQLGSIIQHINDQDDYGTNAFGNNVKRLPDYFLSGGDGAPFTLPLRQLDPLIGVAGNGWSNPYPITQAAAQQGFAIATNRFVPVNGQFDLPEVNLFNTAWYDSEPDIFTADFLGESVKFIINFNSPNQIVVLNKQGYKVVKTADGFTILNPSGTTYYFEKQSVIKSYFSSLSMEGPSSSGIGDEVSKIFLLTKIITKTQKNILLQYFETGQQNGYPSCSGKLQSLTNGNVNQELPPHGGGNYEFAHFDARNPSSGPGPHNTYSTSSEKYVFLKTIIFPQGKIDFSLSDRNDLIGGKKLDKVELKNTNAVTLKSWDLNYSYFDASNVVSNGYGYNDNDVILGSETRSALRLKLSNVHQSDGGIFNLLYNATPLPKKNSFARDYWGFYNGRLTNSSLIPNPASLNLAALGNNGNDKNADLIYTKAAILEGIEYPTGGKVIFDYELNEFNQNQMIGLTSTTGIILGAGLRIRAINHFDKPTATSPATRTEYRYEGGKLINSLQIVRQLPYRKMTHWTNNFVELVDYTYTEISDNGVFSSSPLISINGVGYNKVTKENINSTSVTTGKIVTEFYNHEDIHNPTIASRALYCAIPAIKSYSDPSNGLVKTINIFNNQNHLQKSVAHTYSVLPSNIYYGARIMSYGMYLYTYVFQGTPENRILPRHIIGYYPIYDNETFLTNVETTDFDNNTGSLTTNVHYSYANYGQMSFKQTRSSTGEYLEEYYDHAYQYYQNTGDFNLLTHNILDEVTTARSERRKSNYFEKLDVSKSDKEYTVVNGNVVVSKATETMHVGPFQSMRVTTFDFYDDRANLLQITSDGMTSSMLWDYNQELMVGKVANAKVSEIAYTSFESNGKGQWIFSGQPYTDLTAPTGNKVYSLANGTLGTNGLDGSKTYIVSYWSKSGSQSVSGASSITTGFVSNGWTQYEHTVVQPLNAISISGAGIIDEVRLYPKEAQMTTYTYTPLLGVSALCDINNRIQYYEYDASGHLSLVRDKDHNILKKYCYNYAGQVEDCGINTAPIWQTTGQTRCKLCTANNSYTSNIQEHQEIDANPNSPGYNTSYRWVEDGISGNCVPQAAWQVISTVCEMNRQGQNTGNQLVTEQDVNSCSSTFNTTRQVSVYNPSACPLQSACNTSNCTGPDKQCINGVCETGLKIYTSSVKINKFTWECTYRYCFSDSSQSAQFTESSSSACNVILCYY